MSNFELRIRKQTLELNTTYSNVMLHVTQRITKLTDLVVNNSKKISELMEDGKLRFAMFDMKRRNYGGTHPNMRAPMDMFWMDAMLTDHDVELQLFRL